MPNKTYVTEQLELGLLRHRAGKLEEALAHYAEVLQRDPQHSDALHLSGLIYFQRGDLAKALELVERAVLLRPNMAEFHNSLGAIYRASEKFDRSILAFQKAVALRPEYAEAYNNLGNVMRQSGRGREARTQFEKALQLQPQFEAARKNLDSLNKELGNLLTVDSVAEFAIRRIVLHVGCGAPSPESLHQRFRDSTWQEVRLDIDPAVNPDIVSSIVSMPAVDDRSVDAIWSSHNLEHLAAHEVAPALIEFHRVLISGGMLFVTLPDLRQIAECIIADQVEDTAYISPAGPIRPLDCLFGLASAIEKGNSYMAHRTGFTAKTLQKKLEQAGFVKIKVWTTPLTLWAEAWKAGHVTA